MWGYHIKYGRLSADVMLSQRMRRSVSSLDTLCFSPMIHRVSAHDTQRIRPMILSVSAYETQRFNTWNAGFQYMERRVSVHGTHSLKP